MNLLPHDTIVRQKRQQENVTTNWINRWETRKFTLSATYSFGKRKKKKVEAVDLSDKLATL